MNEFKQFSEPFTTRKDMERIKKAFKNSIADHYNVSRSQMRLQQGTILLQGLYNGKWLNITTRINDFPEKLKNKSYSEFRLYARLNQL